MGLNNIVVVIGGLAFFLFGMSVLSTALKKVAGKRLEVILEKMTDHPLKGLVLGAIITIAMQSSSALTVMLVGLVNSGIMNIAQTVGVIMGSNIGTTLTAWILSLSGLQTDNIFLSLLKPANFSPIMALIGVCLIMAAKEQRKKDLGQVLVGFAILMHGMEMMSDALSPLSEVPEFVDALTAFRNPFFGVLIGTLFTAIIQSSAASVGVLQALSLTGHITYGVAIPIIMGQNIGTCVTALLSTIGVSKNAKRVSVIHISFNLIGTAIGLVLYLMLDWGMKLPIFNEAIKPFEIAAFHSIFNIVTTLILLPLSKNLVNIAENVIKDDGRQEVFLDKRLLLTPAIAVKECKKKSALILQDAMTGYMSAISLIGDYDGDKRDNVKELEEKVDEMVESCNNFLIQLSSKDVSDSDSETIATTLHTIGDMERISDYSLNLSTVAKKIDQTDYDKKELKKSLKEMNTSLESLFENLALAYETDDISKANTVRIQSEELVDQIKKAKKSDLKKLRKGKMDAEMSVYMSDYLSISRRVVEHIQNIAEAIII